MLSKIGECSSNGATIDYGRMNIEHLTALNPAAGVPDFQAGSIGNLILAESRFNNKLGNKPFSAKHAMLKQSKIFMDPTLANATTWTSKEMAERGEWLAEIAYQKVWKV